MIDYCNCLVPDVKWSMKYPHCINCNKWVLMQIVVETDTVYISQLNRRIKYGSLSDLPKLKRALEKSNAK